MTKFNDRLEQAGLFKLPKLGAITFCLACAERMRPVILHLASKKTRAVFDEALDVGWSALIDSGELNRIENLLTALRISRDVTSEPARRTFYVKFPLQALYHALHGIIFDSATDDASSAWACSTNLARGFDYCIRNYCNASSNVSLDELTCEDLENDGIEESLRILALCGDDFEKVRERLRPESQARSRHLETAASRIDAASAFGTK